MFKSVFVCVCLCLCVGGWVCVCVCVGKRLYTATDSAFLPLFLQRISADAAQHFFLPAGGAQTFSPSRTGSADIFSSPQGERRGHMPVLDTCANEAIPRWGKGGLINHLDLQAWPAQSTLKRCLFLSLAKQ